MAYPDVVWTGVKVANVNIYYKGVNYKAIAVSGVIAGLAVGVLLIGGIFCWPADFIVLLVAGALAAHLSAETAEDRNELPVNGALAGLVAGLVSCVIYVIMVVALATLYALILGGMAEGTSSGTGLGFIGLPFMAGAMGFACCMPLAVTMGAFLGALGAMAYLALWKKPEGMSTV